jgi:hypothetical protein
VIELITSHHRRNRPTHPKSKLCARACRLVARILLDTRGLLMIPHHLSKSETCTDDIENEPKVGISLNTYM